MRHLLLLHVCTLNEEPQIKSVLSSSRRLTIDGDASRPCPDCCVVPVGALGAHSVDLVDEHDAGRMLAGLERPQSCLCFAFFADPAS